MDAHTARTHGMFMEKLFNCYMRPSAKAMFNYDSVLTIKWYRAQEWGGAQDWGEFVMIKKTNSDLLIQRVA